MAGSNSFVDIENNDSIYTVTTAVVAAFCLFCGSAVGKLTRHLDHLTPPFPAHEALLLPSLLHFEPFVCNTASGSTVLTSDRFSSYPLSDFSALQRTSLVTPPPQSESYMADFDSVLLCVQHDDLMNMNE